MKGFIEVETINKENYYREGKALINVNEISSIYKVGEKVYCIRYIRVNSDFISVLYVKTPYEEIKRQIEEATK